MPTIPSDAHAVNDTGHTTDHDNLVDVVGTLIIIAGQLYQLSMATPANNTNNQPNLNSLAALVGSTTTAVLSNQLTTTNLVLGGTTAPASGTGINGDTYVNTATGQYYVKASGAWGQSGLAGFGLLATTGLGGYTLVNGTGTILSWTAPSDGLMHRVFAMGNLKVTTLEVGGQISVSFTDPTGAAQTKNMFAAAQAVGYQTASIQNYLVQAGTTVSVTQSTALTGGASTLFSEIWGS